MSGRVFFKPPLPHCLLWEVYKKGMTSSLCLPSHWRKKTKMGCGNCSLGAKATLPFFPLDKFSEHSLSRSSKYASKKEVAHFLFQILVIPSCVRMEIPHIIVMKGWLRARQHHQDISQPIAALPVVLQTECVNYYKHYVWLPKALSAI